MAPILRRRRRLPRALAALAAVALVSCSDHVAPPVTRDLAVTVFTNGDDIDLDGYVLMLDNASVKTVGANEEVKIPKVAAGTHLVSLDGVASNCVVVGVPTQSVNIESGDDPVVHFALYCAMTGIQVTVNTVGDDLDLDGYDVNIGNARDHVASGQVLALGRLTPGAHTVTLESLAPNCTVAGENPRAVNVINRNVTPVDFVVTCKATTGSILVRVATTGVDQYLDGYKARLDDAKEQPILSGGATRFLKVAPGDHTVRLDGVADNCVVSGGALRTVHVTAGEDTEIALQVDCVKAELIAFTRVVDGYARVNVMRPDGTNIRYISTGFDPSWSADGMRLVYRFEDCYYYYYYCDFGLYAVGSDGTNTKRLTTSDDRQPDWSPDGSKIAFARFEDGHSRLVVLKSDGSAPTVVSIPEWTGDVEDPAWSPNGSQIAFTCVVNNFQSNVRDICVVNADGSGLRRLTNDVSADWSPSWSPDGTRIAFSTTRFAPGAASIAVMRTDGSNVQQLAAGWGPAWSRDGSKIVFVGLSGLFVMNSDGTGSRRLTNNETDYAPAWRP